MYCNKCGNNLNDTDIFCQNCGNKIQITNSKNSNNITFKEIQKTEKVESVKNKHLRFFNEKFNTPQEKILLISNIILYTAIFYYILFSLGFIVASIIFDAIFCIFIVMFGGELFTFSKEEIAILEDNIIILMCLFIVLIIINGIIYLLIRKKNNPKTTDSKLEQTKSGLYQSLISCFKKITNIREDKQMIKYYLILFGASALGFIIGIVFDIDSCFYIALILLGSIFGLKTTINTIALAKISNIKE